MTASLKQPTRVTISWTWPACDCLGGAVAGFSFPSWAIAAGCDSEPTTGAPSGSAEQLGVPAPDTGWPFGPDTNPPILNAGVHHDEAGWIYLSVSTVGSAGAFPIDARVGELGRANDEGHAIVAVPPGAGFLRLSVGGDEAASFCDVTAAPAAGEVVFRDVAFPASERLLPECDDISDLPDRR